MAENGTGKMASVTVFTAHGEFDCEYCPEKIKHGHPYIFTQVKKGSNITWVRAHAECHEKMLEQNLTV